jgi:hypothetical protein
MLDASTMPLFLHMVLGSSLHQAVILVVAWNGGRHIFPHVFFTTGLTSQ